MAAAVARYNLDDTIVAISSPPAASKIGIVRLSGVRTFAIAAQLGAECGGDAPTRRLIFGELRILLRACHGEVACRCPARLLFMPAPRSYTCEHMAEFHVPGAPPVVQAVYNAALAAGARPAEAGEFTFRAFIHGRLDIGQAEAVERLISATSRAEQRQAIRRLVTPLAQKISAWREEMLLCAAQMEAALDLEAEETEGALPGDIESRLANLAASCRLLAAEASTAEHSRQTTCVALLGLANAGKSSLANALLGRHAALVAAEAGTTRDLLSWPLTAGQLPVLLVDTVGYRPQPAGLDDIAFHHAFARALTADVLCLVIDGSQILSEDLRPFLRLLRGRSVMLIRSKVDLPQRWQIHEAVAWCKQEEMEVAEAIDTSAISGKGVAILQEAITRRADAGQTGYLHVREAKELREAGRACDAALVALREGSIEIAAEEIRLAYASLERLGGEGYAEEVLERIFSRFCVGK